MKKEVFVVLFLMLLVPLVSAEITISQPKNVYNLGDDFLFNVSVIPSANVNNFFVAKLSCIQKNAEDSSSPVDVEIFRTPMSVKSGVQKSVEVSGAFDNFLAGDMEGKCHLDVVYGPEANSTPDFKITKSIYINLVTDKAIVEPEERLNVSGKAIKGNGEQLTKGIVEFRIDKLDISSFKTLDSNDFGTIIEMPEDAPAGDYDVSAKVYEKDDEGNVTNSGESNTSIKIKQVVRKNEIAISSQDVKPGNEFTYTNLLYDQTEENIASNVEISVYKPNGELFLRNVASTGEESVITLESNSMPGTWKVESVVNGLNASREFYVLENEEVSFSLTNGTLTVTNIGNVPYKKNVDVLIGGTSNMREIYVDVGETRRFVLSAPDGEYEIGIDEGDGSSVLGTSFLTGSAISVDSEGGGFWSGSSLIIWLMLISLGVLVAIQQYGRVANKSYYGRTPSASQATYSAPINLASVSSNKKDAITEGAREECSVISLKVKNHAEIEKAQGEAMDALDRALTRARDARAKIFSDREYKTMIFAPSITKEKDNNMKAVAIAREIENILTDHNKRFGEKIMFGIGVHNGEMIVESSNGQFKVNSIGNTIPYAKKIADSSSSSTGVSEHVHRRVLGKVKSDKIEGTNYWRVSKVRDSGLHSDFINKFVERQRKEGTFKK